ncbi:glycoside hydrolase family 16 protein [Sphaerisporangium rufum]|uniref:glycoside hydrolase family 16 protein n=1 Tax=Sphaerisporangium rufum TaxID=1381558 RepID=UPI00194DE4AC|nr:glycoside hydrolase family 16 protein [Sphaerisporangium rufum]
MTGSHRAAAALAVVLAVALLAGPAAGCGAGPDSPPARSTPAFPATPPGGTAAGSPPPASPPGTASGSPAATAVPGPPAFFDDFSYQGPADPRLGERGWAVRSAPGGPGVAGATWAPGNVAFEPDAAGGTVVRLTAETDGTPAGTRQAQLGQRGPRFLAGTYGARVWLEPDTDPPDRPLTAFYTVSAFAGSAEPSYSELDFEYTANGGWSGYEGPAMYAVTWESFQPGNPVRRTAKRPGDVSGWRTLVIQVGDGRVRYYVDGEPFGDHGGRYYPESPMGVNFAQRLIKEGLDTGESAPRAYTSKVDWFYFTPELIDPDAVSARVAERRQAGTAFQDTVPAP